jgi:hypothetical protein
MVAAVSMLNQVSAVPYIDMLGISVASYEERRRALVPFVLRVVPSHGRMSCAVSARMCRLALKGGMKSGGGRRMLVTGKIAMGARS